VLIDATVGVGVAPAVGDLHPAISGGIGVGVPFM
jgi:hypothetical protein